MSTTQLIILQDEQTIAYNE